MTRYATVTGPLDTIRRYLPSNYAAVRVSWYEPDRILIIGEDHAGWTLDDYVIPRLASGLYWAREISADERDVLLEEARVADEIEYAHVRGISAPDF